MLERPKLVIFDVNAKFCLPFMVTKSEQFGH